MENKIYIHDLPCYKKAPEGKRKNICKDLYFDLELLPTLGLRKELNLFIKERGANISLGYLWAERYYYHRLCKFLSIKRNHVDSLLEREWDVWLKQLKMWILSEGKSVTKVETSVYGKEKVLSTEFMRYLKKVYHFIMPQDDREEIEKDIWELSKVNINHKVNPIKNVQTLNFTRIIQPDIREETKKAILLHLQDESLDCINKELTAMRRISKYLSTYYPEVTSCGELDREIMEEYLIHLKTEDTGLKVYRAHLMRLRAILETIGKLYQFGRLETLFLNSDFPRMTKPKIKTYSDPELKRLNYHIFKMDEQICRVMIVHQMLGTRISDTLTLQRDCLFEQDEHPMIRIQQMKTSTYIKPISAELSLLLEKAINYTKQKYGETQYIFVDDKNPSKPLQYNTIQNKIMAMIQKEKLCDDNGNLFGFGTHMFRHYYGIKLTEMHLDDWTIAKMLGHKSIKNVKYYRKMSLQILADETREIRDRMSQMIIDNLDGWGEEYEQIRKDDSCQ
ncbi:tyrosine-type recombinase/integrase [Blautia producta]|uniref:tyrosine-type recombinase/integrase n=1 Tax=Blautia producta TaxID=33035 RepID=UPI0031B5C667